MFCIEAFRLLTLMAHQSSRPTLGGTGQVALLLLPGGPVGSETVFQGDTPCVGLFAQPSVQLHPGGRGQACTEPAQ